MRTCKPIPIKKAFGPFLKAGSCAPLQRSSPRPCYCVGGELGWPVAEALCVRSSMVRAEPTSACRMARLASTSTMTA